MYSRDEDDEDDRFYRPQSTSTSKSGDRKLWNKSSNKDLNLEYPDYAADYQQHMKSYDRKYEQHLFHLHLNNQ